MDTNETASGIAVSATISETLASFAAGLRYEDLPAELTEFLKDHIIDTFGVAASATPTTARPRSSWRTFANIDAEPPVSDSLRSRCRGTPGRRPR